MTQKVHIETWGCQMNVADSENMLAILAGSKYEMATSEEDADLVLLNTCHIREKARHKIVSRLGKLKILKKQNPNMRIAVGGCVAQAEGARLLQQAPQIDILFGPGKIADLPRLLLENSQTGKPAVALGFKKRDENGTAFEDAQREEKPSLVGKNPISRYVNIVQGCNNCCTFCVVPFTRGPEVSRQPFEVVSECESLVRQGAKEITLLGQNVNSYGLDLIEEARAKLNDHHPFAGLLKQVAEIPNLRRVRYTTSNPHDFTPQLANLFRDHPEQMGRYLHLPVQSGNDRVLEAMKRKVTRAEFLERVAWLRSIDPEFALSTDLIVGFPGETEQEFLDTVSLIEEVGFSFIFSFMYSSRKNTVAARMKDQIDDAEKTRRLQHLNAVQDAITMRQIANETGKTRKALFSYESKKEPGAYYGRTEHFRLVKVQGRRNILGEILSVRVTGGNKTALSGQLA